MEKKKRILSRGNFFGNKGRKRRQGMGALLAAALVFQALPWDWLPVNALEVQAARACVHHTEHTTDCSYSPAEEGGKGTPCTFECRICPIEERTAALPDEVNEDNTEQMQAQIKEILDLYAELTEEEQEQADISRCFEVKNEPGKESEVLIGQEDADVTDSAADGETEEPVKANEAPEENEPAEADGTAKINELADEMAMAEALTEVTYLDYDGNGKPRAQSPLTMQL